MRISFLPAHAPLIFACAFASHFYLLMCISFLPAHAHLIYTCACASHLDLLMRISIWPARAHLILACTWRLEENLQLALPKLFVDQRRHNKFHLIGVPQFLRRVPSVAISILGKEITPVPVARDLGVFIDQYLTYGEHVTQTAAKC